MRVLIVDDDALIRDSLKMILEMEEDFQVVGLAANGEEALELCRKELPDLVLMDIRMPVMDGVVGTRRIKALYPQVRVVILTTFRDEEYIKEALKNGAEGYILKSQPADSIVESLRAVGKGNIVLERDVASSLSAMLRDGGKTQCARYALTEREMEVLSLVGQGLSNREIAEKLFLSEGTVRNYVTALLEKLGLRDRTQLAIFYVRHFE
ncbi:MAG TPA: response regulator transcription factor [Bacillota bacterium]|nr:response regulator transcription factor [Bacillota bacterium]HPZ89729.1 response regulator transcription factor [Bacillota bacterium]HQE01255.1 response regulator transcription factor [Bacillota bacterium]